MCVFVAERLGDTLGLPMSAFPHTTAALMLCLAGLALWTAWQDEPSPAPSPAPAFDISDHYTPQAPTTATLNG